MNNYDLLTQCGLIAPIGVEQPIAGGGLAKQPYGAQQQGMGGGIGGQPQAMGGMGVGSATTTTTGTGGMGGGVGTMDQQVRPLATSRRIVCGHHRTSYLHGRVSITSHFSCHPHHALTRPCRRRASCRLAVELGWRERRYGVGGGARASGGLLQRVLTE